jgi:hypothetical protein
MAPGKKLSDEMWFLIYENLYSKQKSATDVFKEIFNSDKKRISLTHLRKLRRSFITSTVQEHLGFARGIRNTTPNVKLPSSVRKMNVFDRAELFRLISERSASKPYQLLKQLQKSWYIGADVARLPSRRTICREMKKMNVTRKRKTMMPGLLDPVKRLADRR